MDQMKVDRDGCFTLPDGECISAGPCIHTQHLKDDFPAAEDYEVKCARCGRTLLASQATPEEGDEWECWTCNDMHNRLEKLGLRVESLIGQLAVQRQKNRSQRMELRRLNAAHLRKNARIQNSILDIEALKVILQMAGVQIVVLPSDMAALAKPKMAQTDGSATLEQLMEAGFAGNSPPNPDL